jgi:hypothetical protein
MTQTDFAPNGASLGFIILDRSPEYLHLLDRHVIATGIRSDNLIPSKRYELIAMKDNLLHNQYQLRGCAVREKVNALRRMEPTIEIYVAPKDSK